MTSTKILRVGIVIRSAVRQRQNVIDEICFLDSTFLVAHLAQVVGAL
jgi:hypothetical protein